MVDSASPARLEQIREVGLVLKEIGAESIPEVLVWNKIDLAAEGNLRYRAGLERNEYGKISRLFVSAQTRDGMEFLRQTLIERAHEFTCGTHAKTPETAEVMIPSAVFVS